MGFDGKMKVTTLEGETQYVSQGPAAAIIPVSYTHLDVYKRQLYDITQGTAGSRVIYFTANPNGEEIGRAHV